MKQISWCITVKNRCNPTWEHIPSGEQFTIPLLKDNLTQLLLLQQDDEEWEICISDWGSTDTDMRSYVQSLVPIKGILTTQVVDLPADKFSRGSGLNAAYNISTHNNIFFLDADMFFKDRSVIDQIYHHLNLSKVYFPICSSYIDRNHSAYRSRENGKGNVAITREDFRGKIGGWLEKYTWGSEDGDMWNCFRRKAVRDYTETFFHQWHPAVRRIPGIPETRDAYDYRII